MEREPLSACEAMIMKVIWDQKGDISVPELIDLIQERYKRDYKRTTVVTFLTRLNGKGFISSRRAGRISYIHAEKSEENTRQSSQRARLISGSTASRPSSSQHFQTTSLFLKKISNR